MAFGPIRSIRVPIILGGVAVALSIAMLVGWILVLVGNVEQVQAHGWLMAGGSLSFLIIVAVLVLFSVFLVREILEGRRHVRFIDSVTHELKSPLASMKLMTETLARRDLPAEKRGELLRMMVDDIDRLSVFVDDILQASRLGYGPGDHLCTTVRLRDLVERSAMRVQERYKVGEGAIAIEVPESIELLTEPTALEVVLRNLLDNAVKYSNEPVEVRIQAMPLGEDRVVIKVADKGIGIPRQHLKRIFDRFYRAPLEVVHARRGTGLGLYVASSLVQNLGGRLVAESAGPGRGTTMHFDLPLFLVRSAKRSA